MTWPRSWTDVIADGLRLAIAVCWLLIAFLISAFSLWACGHGLRIAMDVLRRTWFAH